MPSRILDVGFRTSQIGHNQIHSSCKRLAIRESNQWKNKESEKWTPRYRRISRYIEAVRRLFPQCWFNEATTEAGIEALGYYHEKKDEQRDVGLASSHYWSSHAADAFRGLAVRHKTPEEPKPPEDEWSYRIPSPLSWMSS